MSMAKATAKNSEKHTKLEFEYSKITDQIYIGTNQCCVAHFKKNLIQRGIHADISLEEKRIDAPFGAKYYLWMPVRDHAAPNPRQFEAGTRFLDELIRSGEKVYVHCRRGHGRAPALVAAYLALYGHLSPEKAFQLIRQRRPAVHPNARQMSAVKKFVLTHKLRGAII